MNEQTNQPSSHGDQGPDEHPIPTDLPSIRGEIDVVVEFVIFHFAMGLKITERLKRLRRAELEAMSR